MSPKEFYDQMSEELGNINVSLLSIETVGSALCIKWKFEEERPFTSAFFINNEYLMTFPKECMEAISREVLQSLTEPDNLVGRIVKIKRRKDVA
jgi:hypothetical protein